MLGFSYILSNDENRSSDLLISWCTNTVCTILTGLKVNFWYHHLCLHEPFFSFSEHQHLFSKCSHRFSPPLLCSQSECIELKIPAIMVAETDKLVTEKEEPKLPSASEMSHVVAGDCAGFSLNVVLQLCEPSERSPFQNCPLINIK